jgi:hypothetical protein
VTVTVTGIDRAPFCAAPWPCPVPLGAGSTFPRSPRAAVCATCTASTAQRCNNACCNHGALRRYRSSIWPQGRSRPPLHDVALGTPTAAACPAARAKKYHPLTCSQAVLSGVRMLRNATPNCSDEGWREAITAGTAPVGGTPVTLYFHPAGQRDRHQMGGAQWLGSGVKGSH